jgi:PilZ domain
VANLLLVVPDKLREQGRAFANMVGVGGLRNAAPIPQLVWGSLAFLIYEVSIGSLMSYLDKVRPVSVFFLELLVFALVVSAMVLYSRVLALETERVSFSPEGTLRRDNAEQTRFESRLSEKLETLSGGIEHSLSAITFFARAQLAKATSPQTERDLREVMERIDQIQFLLEEMREAVDSKDSETSGVFSSAQGPHADPPGKSFGPHLDRQKDFRHSNKAFSLRKSARKVVILPITVNYVQSDTQLRFHTYTVNICEGGACILFSGQDLDEKALIGLQMPHEIQAQAWIRWVQPSVENSFRLAGVEFINHRAEVTSL